MGKRKYSKEELINYMIAYYDEYKKVPTTRGINNDKKYPDSYMYRRYFGSFKNALVESGLFELRSDKHQFDRKEYSDKDMILLLGKFIDNNNGRYPTDEDVDNCSYMPSSSTYYSKFGGIYNAPNKLGYDINKYKQDQLALMEKDMIDKYIIIYKEIGRVPNSRDIEIFSNKDSSFYGMATYVNHFGSLFDLQSKCNLTPTVIGRNKTKDDMLNDLIWLYKKLNRTPVIHDLREFNNLASNRKYVNEFGSFSNALQEVGIKKSTKNMFTNKGTKCLSFYEYRFISMLEEKSINFKKEVYYKDVMPVTNKYRFDLLINIDNTDCFIEIFGITNNQKYKDKTLKKINLCKKYNINLVEFYPEDIIGFNNDETYNQLINKIKVQYGEVV